MTQHLTFLKSKLRRIDSRIFLKKRFRLSLVFSFFFGILSLIFSFNVVLYNFQLDKNLLNQFPK